MNNLMSLLTISTSETQSGSLSCENCTSNDAAKGRCSDCCVLLCDFCLKAHQRFKDTQEHKIMSLEEVKKQGAPAMTQQVKCDKHKGEVKKLYCESCQQLICRDCTIIDHREHQFQFIDEVAGRLTENLKCSAQNAVQARSKVEGTRKTVREMKEKIKTKCDNTLKEIEDAVQEQIAFLMNKEKELKEEVKRIADNKTKVLDEQDKELTQKLNGLDNSIQFTQKVLQDGNNINILSVSSEANSRLVTLTNQVPYIENQPREQDDFSLQHDRDNFQSTVENGMKIIICNGWGERTVSHLQDHLLVEEHIDDWDESRDEGNGWDFNPTGSLIEFEQDVEEGRQFVGNMYCWDDPRVPYEQSNVYFGNYKYNNAQVPKQKKKQKSRQRGRIG
ncbi:E3 ubiquitin-protein ligase TRIM33-like [Exaiptasia diaphana]|uniref:B box-type domain-containing protein n=1 Tax=Exaiptasia diaphana TaxID=2652724 RepID=A0A913XXD4_EXADI|nr:E3 ubiquitin-protein ligase TRIM33-like [Exaiptasia diaphana]